MKKLCPKCGREYEDKKFCTDCGISLIGKETEVAATVPEKETKEALEEKPEKTVVIDEANTRAEKNPAEEKAAQQTESVFDEIVGEKKTVLEQPEENKGEPEKAVEDKLKEEVSENNTGTEKVLKKIDELEKLFEERIRFTDFEENSRKEMYSELQKHKAGLFSEMVKPLLREIIDVRESMLKAVAKYQNEEEKNSEKILAEFKSYADDDILSLLENYGVEVYQSEPGNDFSATKQRLRKPFVKTTEAKLQGKIAESLSSGYTYNGQTIYGEWVKRYIYEVTEQREE